MWIGEQWQRPRHAFLESEQGMLPSRDDRVTNGCGQYRKLFAIVTHPAGSREAEQREGMVVEIEIRTENIPRGCRLRVKRVIRLEAACLQIVQAMGHGVCGRPCPTDLHGRGIDIDLPADDPRPPGSLYRVPLMTDLFVIAPEVAVATGGPPERKRCFE